MVVVGVGKHDPPEEQEDVDVARENVRLAAGGKLALFDTIHTTYILQIISGYENNILWAGGGGIQY